MFLTSSGAPVIEVPPKNNSSSLITSQPWEYIFTMNPGTLLRQDFLEGIGALGSKKGLIHDIQRSA
jgi:hypothetical protein